VRIDPMTLGALAGAEIGARGGACTGFATGAECNMAGACLATGTLLAGAAAADGAVAA